MYIKTLILSLLISFSIYSQVPTIKIDDVGDGWKQQVEQAINLIQQTDDLRYSLLLKNCIHITYGVNGHSTTTDSTIVIDKSVFDLNSKNNLGVYNSSRIKTFGNQILENENDRKKRRVFYVSHRVCIFFQIKRW